MSERPMHAIPGAFQKLTELYVQGEQLVENGQLEEAVAKFSEAIAIDDHFRQRYVTLYAQRGFALQKLGQLEAAIADYSKAIEMEPEINQAQYHFHRGLCHFNQENYDAALADFSRSIELYPDHPGPWHFRAKLYVDFYQRWADALVDLDRLAELRPNPDGFQLRGLAKFELGDMAGADQDFRRSQSMAPNAYNDYMLACVAARTGNEAELYAALERTLGAEPSYADNVRGDNEFAAYRESPRFKQLVG